VTSPPALSVRALLLALLLAAAFTAPASAEVVWAVGDGGVPEPDDDAVAAMIERQGIDRLLYLGDVYEQGTAEEYRTHYAPSFGRFFAKTSPTPGNHEWDTRAEGYDPYWGQRAPRTAGGHYYSFDYAGWHIVSLNSEESRSETSPQLDWLRRDLAGRSGTCTLAFFHKPRYSAGPSPKSNDVFEPFWAALAGKATLALSGHDHNYQRLRPERGITQFIVGTGGRTQYEADKADPRLLAVDDTSDGALRMVLAPGQADFAYVTADGVRRDAGSLACTPPSSSTSAPAAAPAPGPTPAPGPSPSPAPGSSDSQAAPAVRPRVGVLRPRSGRRYSRRLTVLRGSARLPAGARVRLSLTRRRGSRCDAYDGRRFVRGRCRRPPTFTARGGERWSLRLPARPRAGAYRLTARVVRSGDVLARATSAFRIR